MLGDYSSTASTYDFFKVHTQEFCGRPAAYEIEFDNFLKTFSEFHQPDFTHCTIRDDRPDSFSRTDRIYSNLPPTVLLDMHINTFTFGRAQKINFDLSDHTPVGFSIEPCTSSEFRPRLMPKWIPRHKLWQPLCSHRTNQLPFSDHPFTMLQAVKDVFYDVADDIKLRVETSGCSTAMEKMWWAIRCLRELRRGSDQVEDFIRAYPDLIFMLDPALNFGRLEGHIAELGLTTGEDMLREANEIKESDSDVKAGQISKASAWISRFSPRRRKVGISGILAEDGSLITDPKGTYKEVATNLGTLYKKKKIEVPMAKAVIGSVISTIMITNWILDFDHFCYILDKISGSAPGPDGILYSCYRLLGPQRRVLYEAYLAWLKGDLLPPNSSLSFLILIPKVISESDLISGCSRRVLDLRPLFLSNTDVKIFEIMSLQTSQAQHGYLKRCMLKNVIDLERSRRANSRYIKDYDTAPVLFLGDYASVFSFALALVYLVSFSCCWISRFSH